MLGYQTTDGDIATTSINATQSAYNGEEDWIDEYEEGEEEEGNAEEENEEEENDNREYEEANEVTEEEIEENPELSSNPNLSEEDSEFVRQRKMELIQKHKDLLERRRKEGELNMRLQNRLAEYFRRKRADAVEATHSNVDSVASSVVDTGVDWTSRYNKYMETLANARDEYVHRKAFFEWEIGSLRRVSNKKKAEAAKKHKELAEFIELQGKKAISYKTGRPLPIEQYTNMVDLYAKKNALVTNERLENLKLQRQVEKINAIFKALDLSEGLHLIDFEQLKIENQTYNEKIEERNEETGKLRRKITNTVQVMTHAKEKLHACQSENSTLKEQLKLSTDKFNSSRDILTKLKQTRDALKVTHGKLQRTCGLLGRTEALRGYEQSVDDVEAKKQEIADLVKTADEFLMKAKLYEDKVENLKLKIQCTYH